MTHAEWLRTEATKAESWGEHGRAERLRAIAAHIQRLEEATDAEVTREELLAALHEVAMSVRVAFKMRENGHDPDEGLSKMAERCETLMAARLRRKEGSA